MGGKQKDARGGRRIPEDDRFLLWSNDECIEDSGLGGHIVNVEFVWTVVWRIWATIASFTSLAAAKKANLLWSFADRPK